MVTSSSSHFLEVDVQQGNFKILWLLYQVLILFLVEKWIPPTRSESTEIGKKNRSFRGLFGYIPSVPNNLNVLIRIQI
jgi:hypothetical protein